MREAKELESFNLLAKVRKLGIDESRCWDKICPLCGAHWFIMLWDLKEHKYTHGRCSELKCKYGND